MTKELTDRFLAALAAAGVRARAAYPAEKAVRPAAPETTVSLEKASALPAGLGGYLGALDDPETGPRALCGRRLEAVFRLRVASPVSLGGEGCAAEADRVMDALLAGIDGMELRAFSAEPCGFDPGTDCFFCVLRAEMRALLYALPASADETVGDFELEGELH